MATITNKKANTKTKAQTAEPVENIEQEIPVQEKGVENNTPIKVNSKYLENIDLHEMIPCVNATRGKLVYVSKHSGYTEEWSNFGEVAYIEYEELQRMLRTDKKFFTENWIWIDDPRVLRKLGVEKYYKNALDIDNFDTFFDLDIEEIVEKINKMSRGTKNSVVLRALELIESGKLDSIKKIEALEKALDCQLIER